jgi:transposase-like protein
VNVIKTPAVALDVFAMLNATNPKPAKNEATIIRIATTIEVTRLIADLETNWLNSCVFSNYH